jgi:hypothetical protein
MTTLKELQDNVKSATIALEKATMALEIFKSSPQNNVFESVEKACSELEDRLTNQASDDCEGSHNCGQSEYHQEFIVDGVHYIATLTCEYNRHDKTYYFIDTSKFTYKVK